MNPKVLEARMEGWLDFHVFKQNGPMSSKADASRCAMGVSRDGGWRYYQCGSKHSTERCGVKLCGIHAKQFDRRFPQNS